MRFRKRGSAYLIALAIVSFSGCLQKDLPPKIPIGTGDGFGGADFSMEDGRREYWGPSKLKNSWVTTQEGAAKLLSWAYGKPITVEESNRIILELKGDLIPLYEKEEGFRQLSEEGNSFHGSRSQTH